MHTHPVDEQPQCNLSPGEIDNFPPSIRLVLQCLHGTDGLMTNQLAEETGLAERMIRYALTRLDDRGVIESSYLLSEPQISKYTLKTDAQRVVELLER